MAVSTRMAAPNYKVFEPDALDQIYAQKSLDPVMGGIAWAMGNAHKGEAGRAQQEFSGQQDQYNKMASRLDAMDIAQKQKEAALKIAGALAEKGEDPTNLQGMDSVYANPGASLLPGLLRNNIQSEIAHNMRNPSGAGGGEVNTVQETHTDAGTGDTVVTTKKGKGVVIPERPTVDPTASTPIVKTPEAAASSATANQQRIAAQAKTIVGPDAHIVKEVEGHTLWTNGAGNKIAIFDPNGKMVRQK